MTGLGVVLYVIGGIATFIGGIIILIAAFKKSVGTGFLTLCVPFYVLYFVFAQYESEKKGKVIGLWLGGLVLMLIGIGIAAAGGASMAMEEMEPVFTP